MRTAILAFIASIALCPAALADPFESEPNDLPVQADFLPLGEVLQAALSPAGDVDWFRVTVTYETNLAVWTNAGPGQTGGDTELAVYVDGGATLIAYDDDGGEGHYSNLGVHVIPQVYYIRVNEYGDDGTIDAYTLEAYPAPMSADGRAWGSVKRLFR